MFNCSGDNNGSSSVTKWCDESLKVNWTTSADNVDWILIMNYAASIN